jgi:hypothetical protein
MINPDLMMTKTPEKDCGILDLQSAMTKERLRNQFLRSEASLLLSAVSISAFGGAMAATLGESEGAVVLSPLFTSIGNPVVTIPATVDGLYINVETGASGTKGSGVAGWDLNPYSQSQGTRLSWYSPTGGGSMRYPGQTTGAGGSLDLGNVVGSSESFNTAVTEVAFGSGAGQWKLSSDNYFGFRFLAADGGTRYGWGTMQIGESATTRSITELYYEDSGASILVGQRNVPTAVPEPGSPLVLLALGAAGMLHVRRRRAVA